MTAGSHREIPLTKGYVAIVDEADFEWLSQWNWYVRVDVYGHAAAVTTIKTPKGRRHGFMHRFLTRPAAGFVVDHIDGDPLNNRRANLRVCTRAENARNCKKRVEGKPYKGVHVDHRWLNPRYKAMICVNYKPIYLGQYDTAEEAARAYDAAARIHHAEFARLNFPEAA